MHDKKWKSESCSKLKEILKISQKDDVALEDKQTRSVLVLSGNSPFVTSQRDRCIFSYLETDQEAAVCWGSVSVQKQPDDEKNEKQHHDINSTVPTPLFISSAERDTEKTKEWLFNRRWQSDFCILRDLWEATRLAELGCRLDNVMLLYKFFFLYNFLISAGHAFGAEKDSRPTSRNHVQRRRVSLIVLYSIGLSLTFSHFSIRHTSRAKEKRTQLFLFFSSFFHFQPPEAIFIQQYWCWLYCSVKTAPGTNHFQERPFLLVCKIFYICMYIFI